MAGVLRRVLQGTARGLRMAALGIGALLLLTSGAAVLGVWRSPATHPQKGPEVNDITRLNPIAVREVVTPTTLEEIVAAVRDHDGPISIGGGRYSMGGQTATRGTLQLDLRQFARVLAVDTARRLLTVQAGARWRDIQEVIDPLGLSIKVMQTYANFTVGGSLSVNAHGRYVGLGPLILSVRSLRVVLADGTMVLATPTEHSDVFYGAIGGYGGIGVIAEATLELAENVRVRRRDVTMPIMEYRRWFAANIRDSATIRFHNGDIYPDAYGTVHAVTYEETADPVTVPERLIPRDRTYGLNRAVYTVISTWPGGEWIREHVVDPLVYSDEPVTWRNYEASYDVAELEPRSRDQATYVLQEYFIPVDSFDRFVPRMRELFTTRDVNVINVSIRHALPDPGSLLAWARQEVFAFVVYYRQGTDDASREAVGTWTRELIDAAEAVGGTYYLPYQPAATEAQFLRGYPGAPAYFALKARLDPTGKFRNTLWDTYYRAPGDATPRRLDPRVAERLHQRPGYRRDEGQTYLTHPEWYIVYSPDEYAAYLRDHLPTDFPYLQAIGQYWVNYRETNALTQGRYPYNWGYQVMLGVIGTSYSLELTLKGLYENTVGRFTGWTAAQEQTPEDRLAYEVADDYARFIHVRPWYEYRFWPRFQALWSELPWWGEHPVRIWERKLFLSAEYGIKALYATVIERATHTAYGVAEDRVELVLAGPRDSAAADPATIRVIESLGPEHRLVSLPRYDEFRDAIRTLAHRTGETTRIEEISGNDLIFLTGVAPAGWVYRGTDGEVNYTLPVPTEPTRVRVTMTVPVIRLLALIRTLDAEGALRVDHIYDY
jgi:FAD/FMN-containing dehydrogenase